ncbi:MAG: CBS domain-containing protein [Planctomycetes bacterium]|nr:CBS domain-containing protein [Planctomycetota bacterium]
MRYWMTADPSTVREDATLLDAFELMRKRHVRRLPVLRGTGELCGIISISDLFTLVPPSVVHMKTIPAVVTAELERRKVGRKMSAPASSCNENDLLDEVAETMRTRKIGALPVLRGKELVGIITESDVLGALAKVVRGGADTRRVCCKIPPGDERDVIARLVEVAKRFDIALAGVLTHPLRDEPALMAALRLRGERVEEFVKALWDGGFQVLNVT